MLRQVLQKAGLFGWRYVEADKSLTASEFVCKVVATIGRIVEEAAGINPGSTYGDVKAELVSMDPVNLRDASILRSHYGPKPYWTHSEPNSRPESTCQTLYAVANGESVPYILGVVRSSQSDYPITICKRHMTCKFGLILRADSSGPNPTLTVSEAIVTAQPDLRNRILMVTEHSGPDVDIGMEPLEFERRFTATRPSESFPTLSGEGRSLLAYATAILTDEQCVAPSASIPPLLQTLLVHCEHLLRRASNVPTFRAQATHVLQAVLHIILSFSDALQPLFDEQNPGIESAFQSDGSLAELLPVAPQLARQIAKYGFRQIPSPFLIPNSILDCVEHVIRASETIDGDREKTKLAVDQAFLDLCSDFPGAVAVRQSCAVFRSLDRLHDEAPLQIEDSNVASELWVPTREALHAEKLTLKAIRSNLGDNHLDTARAMLSLASGYSMAGGYSKAENLQVKALKILQTQLGDIHPDTWAGMLNLSCIYSARGHRGDYKQAESLQNRVLRGRTQQLGDEHMDTHRARLCLGTTYFRQGRYSEARGLQSSAVEGLTAALGAMHEDTLVAMGELSLTYIVLGLYSEAEALQITAIRGLVDTLGESHISTYKAKLKLASTHYRQGRYAEARALQEKVSNVLTTKLGKTHPDALLAKRDLSLTFSTVGMSDKAEQLQKEALEGLKTKLGPSHPDTRITELYLATTYFGRGRYPDAKLLQTRAVAGLQAALGGNHMAIISAMRDLALTHCAEDNYSEAAELQERILRDLARGHQFGSKHPEALLATRDLGVTRGAKGDLNAGLHILVQALEGLKEVLGETHPETLITMLNIVVIYYAMDHDSDAQKVQREAVAFLKTHQRLLHVGVMSALYKVALSRPPPHEKRKSSKPLPMYSLPELLDILNVDDDGPDSDIDMDDGDDISNVLDMDKDV